MRTTRRIGLVTGVLPLAMILGATEAHADDASVNVGPNGEFANPPQNQQPQPVASSSTTSSSATVAGDGLIAQEPELRRSPFRLSLGPMGVTTGKGFGYGVGLGMDLGNGSVGGRLSAAWLRGEGTNSDGSSRPTGDAIGHYSGEITLDVHKRGPVHPVLGLGFGFLHISRPDASGFAGMGTARLALEYALGLDDADVRIGGSVIGGLVGPVDSDVKDLRAYVMPGAHVAIGF
jgi:hypothetical protein